MVEATGFQVAMVLVGALFGIVNVFIGIILNNILSDLRSQRGVLREIEANYFPRDEFHRFEDHTIEERHAIKTRVGAIEIRLGAWKADS